MSLLTDGTIIIIQLENIYYKFVVNVQCNVNTPANVLRNRKTENETS